MKTLSIKHIQLALGTTAALLVLFCGVTPVLVHAQAASSTEEQTQMTEAIRSAIAADPRSGSLTPAELNSMVAALTASAQAQGLRARDIVVPRSDTTVSGVSSASDQTSVCSQGTPSFLCSLETAFGFDGSNLLPLWLGGTAALLILIIGTLLEIRHLAHRKEMEAAQQA